MNNHPELSKPVNTNMLITTAIECLAVPLLQMNPSSVFDSAPKYSVIQKDGLNFVLLYFLNYTWYINGLHNI